MDRKKFHFSLKEAFSNRICIHGLMIVLAAYLQIEYNNHLMYVNPDNYIQAGISYAFKYMPIILIAGFGGNVPGMITVLLIFFYRTIVYSSFSYLTFILLLVACTVDGIARKRFFSKWYMTILATFFLQIETGVFWPIILWLLSGNDIDSLASIRYVQGVL